MFTDLGKNRLESLKREGCSGSKQERIRKNMIIEVNTMLILIFATKVRKTLNLLLPMRSRK
jgi:hypothetical protein